MKAAAVIEVLCDESTWRLAILATLHITAVQSSDPDTSSMPFGEKLSETTVLLWTNPSVYLLNSGP